MIKYLMIPLFCFGASASAQVIDGKDILAEYEAAYKLCKKSSSMYYTCQIDAKYEYCAQFLDESVKSNCKSYSTDHRLISKKRKFADHVWSNPPVVRFPVKESEEPQAKTTPEVIAFGANRQRAIEAEYTLNNGHWVEVVETDPITDSRNVRLSLYAKTGTNKWDDKLRLTIRCESNKTDLYIDVGQYLGSNKLDMTYRLDNSPPHTYAWDMSYDNSAIFYPKSSTKFIKELFSSKQLAVRLTPYTDHTITAIFDLTALEKKIGNLRNSCGW